MNIRKKMLVTGASGLLGNKIVEAARKEFTVVPLHNTKPSHSDSVKLDITKASEVFRLFQVLKPDAVIHTASETNVDKCETQKEDAWKTNVEGTRNIAAACQKMKSRLAYISTDYVFDGKKGNYSEDDKPNPINYYGFTKLQSENQITRHCRDYVVLRTSVLYGWHPWKANFVTWIIDQLEQGREITVVEDNYNSPTLADNLAEMAVEITNDNSQGLYHASGPERISRYELAQRVAEAFDLDRNLIRPVKMSQLTTWVAKRPPDSSLNTEKIQIQLETKPLLITEGLYKMKRERATK